MLGFTKSLLQDLPLCLVGNAGEPDADSLLMALRVSSNLNVNIKIVEMEPVDDPVMQHKSVFDSGGGGSRRSVSLFVVLVEVVALVDHLSPSKVQGDLPVLARGVAKVSELLLLLPQLLPLAGRQPLIGVARKVIRLVIQNLRSPDTGQKMGRWIVQQ